MSAAPKIVVVSSTNRVKTKAAKEGFQALLPGPYEFLEVKVETEVAAQPFSDAETLLGASNRVRNARIAKPDADFWIGIEGGVDEHDGNLLNFAWVVVASKEGRTGKARTPAYYLPEESARLVREGLELGQADDQVFGTSDSRSGSGSVGLLTGDVVDRAGFYTQAVILALIPIKNKDLTFK
jgi:inosine/xanthosine triphosphatase